MPNPDPAGRPLATALARRLLSLTGVFPLGLFLLLHLAINARALRAQTAFAIAVNAIHGLPAIVALEWLLVLAPLLLHATIGVWLVATRRALADQSPYSPPLGILVRATGVAALVFLAMHLRELRFGAPGARLGGAELATVLEADLSSLSHGVPWRGAAYLVGTACVTFHFAVGLWGFAVSTRLRDDERARKWAGWGAAALGLTIWVIFADVVVLHATGARILGGPAQEPEQPGAPCPARE
ncbi:MAG: hypothetical protein WBY94_27495 [Polyangiaceae bacterium]